VKAGKFECTQDIFGILGFDVGIFTIQTPFANPLKRRKTHGKTVE
jgi:hypothetical protein